jgi:hypothetical protein
MNISVSAPHAVAVLNGVNVTARPPRTEIWALLYAQVIQADGLSHRNILLDERMLIHIKRDDKYLSTHPQNTDGAVYSVNTWSNKEVSQMLAIMGLPISSSLSVLCVEMMPRPETYVEFSPQLAASLAADQQKPTLMAKQNLSKYINVASNNQEAQVRSANVDAAAQQNKVNPLGHGLGQFRILRTSPLTAVPFVCCT